MGVDAEICFQAEGEIKLEWVLPEGFKITQGEDYLKYIRRNIPEVTHYIDTYSRYYGEGYERGNWLNIGGCLMLIFACPQVKKVWYGGDSGENYVREITIEDVLNISKHFMEVGCRPYRED